MVFQQVHFVNVQIAAISLGEQAGLKHLFAVNQGAFNVQGAQHPVFGGPQGQVDYRDVDLGNLTLGVGIRRTAHLTVIARFNRVAAVLAACDGRHFWQQGGESAHSRRLPGSPVSHGQHAAEAGIDRRQH